MSEEDRVYTAMRIAQCSEDLAKIYQLRHSVFVEEEGRLPDAGGMIHDLWDGIPEGINVIAIEGGEAVGAIRFVMDGPLGLPAMDHFDFTPTLEGLEGSAVSVGWFCSTKKHRKHPGMIMGLIKTGVREARRRGGRHVIAPLHPGLFPLLRRIGAVAVAPEFNDEALGVPVIPIHVDMEAFEPGVRETMDDPLSMMIRESSERRIYREGDELIRRGEPGTEAFVVMRGSVRIFGLHSSEGESDREVLLGQGQVFGEISLLDEGPRTTTVVCHSRETDVMVWSKEEFTAEVFSSPRTASWVCRVLASRLRFENLDGPDVPSIHSLVARIIIDASRGGEASVDLRWLAAQIGLWPEQLDAIVEPWIENDIISRGETSASVLDLGRLQDLLRIE